MEYREWRVDLPWTDFKMYAEPLEVVLRFYKTHLQRDMQDGKLKGDAWFFVRGFLVSSIQSFAAICALVSEKRPKPLVLQAQILNRALLETLGNLLALLEDPEPRFTTLMREAFKGNMIELAKLKRLYGEDKTWTEYLTRREEGTTIWAAQGGFTPGEVAKPENIKDFWPTPGIMLYGSKRLGIAPMLSGERKAVFQEIYETHYSGLSEQAHQRMAAIGLATLVDEPSQQWNPGHAESHTVSTAMLFLACMLSEIEGAGGYERHAKLRELWTYLREIDGEAKELWTLRYERL